MVRYGLVYRDGKLLDAQVIRSRDEDFINRFNRTFGTYKSATFEYRIQNVEKSFDAEVAKTI